MGLRLGFGSVFGSEFGFGLGSRSGFWGSRHTAEGVVCHGHAIVTCAAVPAVDSMHAAAGTRAGGARHAGRHDDRLVAGVRLARRALEASISEPDAPTATSTGAGRVGGILLDRELDRRIGEDSSPLPTERAVREM